MTKSYPHSLQLVSLSKTENLAPVANIRHEQAMYLSKYDWHTGFALAFDVLDNMYSGHVVEEYFRMS